MTTVVALLITFVAQAALRSPMVPAVAGCVFLPLAWVVGASLLAHGQRWPYLGLFLGLIWDLCFEPVVGPGAIAWSATGLVLRALAGVVAHRSAATWALFGGLGAALVWIARGLALGVLGLWEWPTWSSFAVSLVATALWCGAVGLVMGLEVRERWERMRTRRLR